MPDTKPPEEPEFSPADQEALEKRIISGSKGKDATIIKLPSNDCNVVENYKWAVNSASQPYISEVPSIIMTEHQPIGSNILEDVSHTTKQLWNSFLDLGRPIVNQIKESRGIETVAQSPYTKMYEAIPTGNTFIFPFLDPYNHVIQNGYAEAQQTGPTEQIGKKLAAFSSIIARGSVEKRRIFDSSSQSQFTFSFRLYNTFGNAGETKMDIFKNFALIRALLNNNMIDRTGFATILPPCIYSIEIPGVRYCPVAAVTGLSVTNLGVVNQRQVVIPKVGRGGGAASNILPMNIPDAWELTFTIQELMTESRDIFNSTFTDAANKVSVIKDSREFVNEVKQAQDQMNLSNESLGEAGW